MHTNVSGDCQTQAGMSSKIMEAGMSGLASILKAATPIRNITGWHAEAMAAETPTEPTADLWPVVSIKKMASKGCAIVHLRDQEVLELSVAMRVAVIDGVCVEVRRHTRKQSHASEEHAEPVSGVFVAWGHRVERKITVSEEGLEDYFNGLRGLVQIKPVFSSPPFEENLQRFTMRSAGPLWMDLRPEFDDANGSKMLDGPHGRPELVRSLWDAKEHLDSLWARPPPPMGRSLLQRVARDSLFPHSGKEGKEHENRAGEKLEELAAAVGLLDGIPSGSAFLDLCGGPGAWSQFLLGRRDLALRGFGFTLRSQSGTDGDWQAQEKDDWYQELLGRRDWKALWGKDGTGDLLKEQNLDHCANELWKHGGVFLCVADGGFSDKAIPANLLELYFYRLLLAELLTAVSCLQPGGRFVCKLYTSLSAATSSLLFLTTRVFDHVEVVKPMTSRVSGPERYLFASGFRWNDETKAVRAALMKSHVAGQSKSPLQAPLLTPIVPAEELVKDKTFLTPFREMSSTLCQRQAGSLEATLNLAEQLEDMALAAAAVSAEASPPRQVAGQAPTSNSNEDGASASRTSHRNRNHEVVSGSSASWTRHDNRGYKGNGYERRGAGNGGRHGNPRAWGGYGA